MTTLLDKVKTNLVIEHNEDDDLIQMYVDAAVSYAEGFQHFNSGYYGDHDMSPSTEQGVVMLASHFYENRDGSSGGFFGNNSNLSEEAWKTVNTLLRLDREWKV